MKVQISMSGQIGVPKKVDEDARKLITDFKYILKKKGFKIKLSKQSALFHIDATKDAHVVSLDGWHGDGKYGDGAAIFHLYDSENNTHRNNTVYGLDAPSLYDRNNPASEKILSEYVKDHEVLCRNIREYIQDKVK